MRVIVYVLVLAVLGVKAAQDTTEGDVLMPQETLRFLLGCQSDRVFNAVDAPLPVFHTDIDTETGITSQKVTLLDTEQLRSSLSGSVHSEEVVELIIGQLNAAVEGAAANNANRLRNEDISHKSNVTSDGKECTINNNIDISVPAQEVDNFNDRVQVLIQQNSFLLLEQINTLFTYKLRSLREDFENIVKERTKKINRKLDAVLEALGATMPIPSNGGEDEEDQPEGESTPEEEPSSVEAITGPSSVVETSTDVPNMSEEEVTDEPTIEKLDNIRTQSRPSRPVRPFRTTYQPRPQSETTVVSKDPPARSEQPARRGRPVPVRPGRPERPAYNERPARPVRSRFFNRRRQPINQKETPEE